MEVVYLSTSMISVFMKGSGMYLELLPSLVDQYVHNLHPKTLSSGDTPTFTPRWSPP
jgi:hypothetical protein